MSKHLTKAKWLELNGFSAHEVTYLVLGNSYPIKDQLKDAGFKFSPLLRWHAETASFELPNTCSYRELNFNEVFVWDEESGSSFLKEGARDYIETIFNPREEPSRSQYKGAVGERLRDIPVTVRNVGGFDSPYGYKWVYTFEDSEGNLYSWFTTTQHPLSVGKSVRVTGTVKQHSTYRGAQTTQLTRCSLVIS